MNRRTIGIAVICAALLSLAIGAGSASALQRANTYNFGLDGTAGNSFTNEPTSLAFDQTNKKLYAHHVLVGMVGWSIPTPGSVTPLTSPFPLAGAPGTAAATLGIAVDNNAGPNDGRIYRILNTGALEAYSPSGIPVGAPYPIAIPTPRVQCGVAVNSTGEVFVANANAVANTEGKGLRRFSSTGVEGPTIATAGVITGLPCRLAFDGADNLYVATSTATGQVWKMTAASNYTSATLFDPFPANAVTVNKATGHVFVAHPERVVEYDTAGNLIREFGNEFGASTTKRFLGVAVDEATDEVYALDSNTTLANRRVKVFGPPSVVMPEAVTNPATAIARKEATVNGEVDPAGGTDITECRFQWGPTTAYANSANCVPAASVGTPINAATAVSAVLPTGSLTPGTLYHYRLLAKNSEGKTTVGANRTFTTPPAVTATITGAATEITQNTATLNGSFNADSIPTTYYFQYGLTTTYGSFAPVPPPGANGGEAAVSTPVSVPIAGLVPGTLPTGTVYNYRLVGVNSFGTTFGENKTFNTKPAVKDLATQPATNIKRSSVTLNGTFDPNGIATQYYFEYGTTTSYGFFSPVPPPGLPGGETVGPKVVSSSVGGLTAGITYHYRLVAVNSLGETKGLDAIFIPNEEPTITGDVATEVNSDGVVLRGNVNPNALATTYRIEYGPEDCSIVECTKGPDVEIGSGIVDVPVVLQVSGLDTDSTYYFRVVATNSRGTTTGKTHVFKTFGVDSGIEECPNVLVRKQTGAGRAPACRGYELVSAPDSGGYDVSSNVIPGLDPMPGYPRADDKVLYTVRFGAIPGSGNPTNHGGDPYVATRDEAAEEWTTEYIGFQADDSPSLLPFASTLLGADAGLDNFAFGGPDTCDPCFDDGSTNIPLREGDGTFSKGMVGSEGSTADPAGKVVRPFSADGSHLVFGSTTKLEPDGNSGTLSIYDRDLDADTTQVVSTLPDGDTMPGAGVAQLDISEDGSRILIGRLVSTDSAGNEYYDLFMHVGNDPESVEVADTDNGVLYAGMNQDGSKAFFVTSDSLAGDGDAGADLFRADVTPTGATVARVSTGIETTGNQNGCNPVANDAGNHWNTVGLASPATCGVVAIAGGGGVSEADGTVFFLSPEKLDGSSNGTADEPNLYVVEPGSSPDYVATLEAGNPLIDHAVNEAGARDTADFQVTPDGQYSAFATDIPLTGAETVGHVEVYRATSGGGIECPSCTPTNGAPSTDTTLTSGAMNLIDDGRVFYTSAEQLVLRDTNQLNDAYEWDEGSIGLISTGLDTADSGLLSATADGVDIFFYTRQSLAPQDNNGGTMKIYDAREGGGFLFNPPPRDCVASDECHGPGSEPPPPAPINTYEGTEEAQPQIAGEETKKKPKRCKKGFVKKRGKCVKKPKRNNHRTRRASR